MFLLTVDVFGTMSVVGTLLGIAVSVVGLIYAWRADRRKILTYQAHPPVPLGRVLSDQPDYRLHVVLEREGASPVQAEGAYLHFIQFGNLGREAIRGGGYL